MYERFKTGDDGAFRSLYERFSPGLFNYLVRLLGDWHHAEDVLIETFARLANSHLIDRGNLKAWLFRVATNESYKLFRKLGRASIVSEEFLRLHAHNPLVNVEKEIRIQRLLNRLPDQQKAVIILKFFEKMSYQEIAETLCCPLGTVKSRMHEGLKNLKRRKSELQ